MSQKKPVHEIRLGMIRAAIWANETPSHNVWLNVTLSRCFYSNGSGWKNSNAFSRDDLPTAAKVLEMAYLWIWQNQASYRPQKATQQTPTRETDNVKTNT